MLPQPGGAAGRRTISLVCAALAFVAIAGALAYSAGSAGAGCGSALTAFRKPLPSPLLSDAEKAEITRTKANPYLAAAAKAKPTEDCRRMGSSRLITAGLGSLIILIPVLAASVYIYLYWPRHQDD